MPKPGWKRWINSIDVDACGNRWNTDGSMTASMRMPQGRLVSDDGLVVAYDATSARRDARKLPAAGDSKWPRAATSRLPRQLTFNLGGIAARAVLPVDNVAPTDCCLEGSHTHTRGHNQTVTKGRFRVRCLPVISCLGKVG